MLTVHEVHGPYEGGRLRSDVAGRRYTNQQICIFLHAGGLVSFKRSSGSKFPLPCIGSTN